MAQPSRSIRHTNSDSTNPSRLVIGTFNVRGFNAATKRDQLSEDLGRLHNDICCLQETKFPGGIDERSGNYRHIGLPSQSRHYGLAFSVAIQFENQIVRYWSASDIIAVIQLRISNNSILTIINVYGPTSQRGSARPIHLEVERLHDGAKFFRAVREMTRKPVAKLTIHDNSGRTICNAAEINARVRELFSSQFSDPSVEGLNAFTETLSRLTHRITPAEIKRAIGKLNSGRASGHDEYRNQANRKAH